MFVSVSPLRRKLGTFVNLPVEEWFRLEVLESQGKRIKRSGQEFVSAHQHLKTAYILHSGWAATFKLLQNGDRQIISLHVPGDFISLNSLFLRRCDHSAVAITDIVISEVTPQDLSDIQFSAPGLSTALSWAMWRERALSEERLVDLGQRTALERTAHFLLELCDRLRLAGLGCHDSYTCPISQPLLADALGITPIHLNRVLRQLRELGYLTFRGGVVSLDNIARLIDLAQYDPAYLDHPGWLLGEPVTRPPEQARARI